MTRTLLSWHCLEGMLGYLRGQGWMLVVANRDVNSSCGLDGYLKRRIKRQTADYVAGVPGARWCPGPGQGAPRSGPTH